MWDDDARWARLERLSWHDAGLGMTLDATAMPHAEADFAALPVARVLAAMQALEGGAVANPDEERMVGHYWLRAPELAPNDELREAIDAAREATLALVARIRTGDCRPERAERFTAAVVVGIGGSSLGPRLVCEALGGAGMSVSFVDNTDPAGIDRLVAGLDLTTTLTVVISKSGGTKETRNGMLELDAAHRALGLDFGKHAVAVTSAGSKLDQLAVERGFLARLPMWDWVGGRTSVTSAVGLLPAALAGVDVAALLRGAAAMDACTRGEGDNPAWLLASAWYLASEGKAKRAMVMLPYKDQLELLSRYLQQLVMESLGKRLDVDGREVFQGLTVYGNKGSTDQHAYVQQLYDGPDDFFVTFVEVLESRAGAQLEVEPGVTSGDYLAGFLRGTRQALMQRGRGSLTLTLERLDARGLGAVIALYERAVGFYATLVNINAYHQPAVELGKVAAAGQLELMLALREALSAEPRDVAALATAVGSSDRAGVLSLLRHLAANGRARREGDGPPWTWRFAAPQ